MHNLKLMFKLIAVIIAVIMQTGCVNSNVEAFQRSMPNKVVGFSIYSAYEDYTTGVVEAFSKVMDKEGIRYIIKDANGDIKKQISDIENLISENVDIIGILPMDEKAIRNSLNEASRRDIPIVSITQIPWVDVSVTISGGDYANGRGAGMVMREKLNGSGKIILLDYLYDISRVHERLNGFMDGIKGSSIEVIDTLKTSTTEETMETVKSLLDAYPDINGIFACESNQVIGCGAALKALERKDIIVTGIGSEMSIIDMILDGYVTAVAARFPNEHGRIMAEAIIKILAGDAYEKNYEAPFKMINRDNAVEMAGILYGKNIK